MARFYFHVAATDDFIPDLDGSEFASLSACHGHALRIINACLPFVQNDRRRWWIEVADAEGQTVMSVLYPCCFPFGLRACDPVQDARYWWDLLIRLQSGCTAVAP